MLLGLMSACILFSAIYLGRYSGGFDPMVYDERILPGMQGAGRRRSCWIPGRWAGGSS